MRRWLFFWRHYSRLLEHRFALQIHDRADEEVRDYDYTAREEAAKGNLIKQQPYYGQSFHVVLVYAGRRADLLTVFGQKDAVAIVARLQYCDRRINQAINMAGGVNHAPASTLVTRVPAASWLRQRRAAAAAVSYRHVSESATRCRAGAAA